MYKQIENILRENAKVGFKIGDFFKWKGLKQQKHISKVGLPYYYGKLEIDNIYMVY